MRPYHGSWLQRSRSIFGMWSLVARSLTSSQRGSRDLSAARYVSTGTAILLLLVPAGSVVADDKQPPTGADYFLESAQLVSPLQPLGHLGDVTAVRVRAAVASMPDPVETRLARAFDIELAALVNAFQSQGYVVDGFAFTWAPRKANAPEDAKVPYSTLTRGQPSVLIFRRDTWRECEPSSPSCASARTEYFPVFIVGETPTVGVHPIAFRVAARCAMALNAADRTHSERQRSNDGWQHRNCDTLSAASDPVLRIIGPSFSGSIESVANSLGVLLKSAGAGLTGLKIDLVSPSASVGSNQYLLQHPYLGAKHNGTITYEAIAASVEEQLKSLFDFIGPKLGKDDKIVVLAEQSSFGLGVVKAASIGLPLLYSGSKPPISPEQIRWAQFPQNISSIRAEYDVQQQGQDAARRQLLPGRVLELDLSGVDRSSDLPPMYQSMLTSRSDELLLSQTFASLRSWVHPSVVVVVATDIRDRLFMLGQVQRELPGALRVVFEQDNLLVHPDYRDVNRGTIVVPAGDTTLCLDAETSRLDECQKPLFCKQKETAHLYECQKRRLRFPFGTDYAANMFRAVLTTVGSTCLRPSCLDGLDRPHLLVATLAGFQRIPARGIGVLVATEGRVAVQEPFYASLMVWGLIALVIAVWLGLDRHGEAILLFLPVQAIRTGGYFFRKMAADRCNRWANRKAQGTRFSKWLRGFAHRLCPSVELKASGKFVWARVFWSLVLAVAATFVFVQALLSLGPPKMLGLLIDNTALTDDRLAHGYDRWALCSLVAIFVYLAIVAIWRLLVWNSHCRQYATCKTDSRPLPDIVLRHGIAVPFVTMIALAALLLGLDLKSVSTWFGYAGFPMLVVGGFFLALFGVELHRWRRLSTWLSACVTTISKEGKIADWPSPFKLGQIPNNPLSLVVDREDLRILRERDPTIWSCTISSLINGAWPFPDDPSSFAVWEKQLVAEMKVASVALRSTAWCAVLAPAMALAFQQVFPPAFERLQLGAAITLVSLSFAAILYAALVLERDCLLGPMFTRDKDQLSLIGALATIWPKLLAFAVLLCAVFLPDVWDWLHNVGKSMNALG
jgi:hypothetical protein